MPITLRVLLFVKTATYQIAIKSVGEFKYYIANMFQNLIYIILCAINAKKRKKNPKNIPKKKSKQKYSENFANFFLKNPKKFK